MKSEALRLVQAAQSPREGFLELREYLQHVILRALFETKALNQLVFHGGTALRIIHVISDEPDWPGEKGFVTAALIQKYGGDLRRKEIFVCGPPVMLDLVLKELQSLNIPKERIHYERFTF